MVSTKIMILEDHPVSRQLLVSTLLGLGYTNLFAVENGSEALVVLDREKDFDILICDIQMPGIDGLDFLGMAAQIGSIQALIVYSGIASDLRLAIQQLARLSGYDVLGDLEKPYTREQLNDLLCRYSPRDLSGLSYSVVEIPSKVDIQKGMDEGEFIPFYQPKVNLQSGMVVGAEVLVRWSHSEFGLLAPGVFLRSVQDYGLINEMTEAVVRKALTFMRENRALDSISLSVNLEADQLSMPCLHESIRRLLIEFGVSAKRLICEITETGLLMAPIKSIENLVRIRLMGCGVSIDDFGAGFSSLQRICEMPCSELKLDASFTRSLTYNPRSLAAVQSLISLSENLGLQLVAEGIETQEQLDLLKSMGCHIGQGFLFSRPVSASDFLIWLKER